MVKGEAISPIVEALARFSFISADARRNEVIDAVVVLFAELLFIPEE